MNPHEMDAVAEAVVEYYSWFIGEGGREPDELMAALPSDAERRIFLERCDDLVTVMGLLDAVADSGAGHQPRERPPTSRQMLLPFTVRQK